MASLYVRVFYGFASVWVRRVRCFMGVFYVLCVRTFYVLWRSLTCFMPSFMRVFYAVLCVFYLVCFFLIYLFKYILFLKKKKNIFK
jgi:hypothetical protein